MNGISRRSFLRAGSGAAVGAALLSSDLFRTAADAAGNPNALWCEVVRVEIPALIHVRTASSAVIAVSLPFAASDPSSCNRDGVLGLWAFQPGDEAVVELRDRRTPLVGLRIDTCYRSIVGRVVAHSDDQLATTHGAFWLPPDTRLRRYGGGNAAAPRSELRTGVTVHVTARFDPTSQRQVARFVAIGIPA